MQETNLPTIRVYRNYGSLCIMDPLREYHIYVVKPCIHIIDFCCRTSGGMSRDYFCPSEMINRSWDILDSYNWNHLQESPSIYRQGVANPSI